MDHLQFPLLNRCSTVTPRPEAVTFPRQLVTEAPGGAGQRLPQKLPRGGCVGCAAGRAWAWAGGRAPGGHQRAGSTGRSGAGALGSQQSAGLMEVAPRGSESLELVVNISSSRHST